MGGIYKYYMWCKKTWFILKLLEYNRTKLKKMKGKVAKQLVDTHCRSDPGYRVTWALHWSQEWGSLRWVHHKEDYSIDSGQYVQIEFKMWEEEEGCWEFVLFHLVHIMFLLNFFSQHLIIIGNSNSLYLHLNLIKPYSVFIWLPQWHPLTTKWQYRAREHWQGSGFTSWWIYSKQRSVLCLTLCDTSWRHNQFKLVMSERERSCLNYNEVIIK